MSELRHDELWAQQVVAERLEIVVEQHDDGSKNGMYDLSLVRTGRRDALEVTAAIDGTQMAFWNSMPEERWIDPTLVGGWMVSLNVKAKIRTLLDKLPPFLKQFEDQACSRVSLSGIPVDKILEDSIHRELSELGVQELRQYDTEFPGSIYLTNAEGKGGFVDPAGAAIAPWISEFLTSPQTEDIRKKLRESEAVERHAFVIVPIMTTAPDEVSRSLTSCMNQPPSESPNLPEEITHVWVAGYDFARTVLFWQPESGWEIVPLRSNSRTQQ